MAVKIKLMRMGKMRAPYYRVVVADARTRRDGRAIETIGKYHPKQDPSFIEVNSERVQYWLGVGAQPTEAVAAILRVTGDWQRYKGEPAPEPMKVAAPKPNRREVFEAAAREGIADVEGGPATTPRQRAPRRETPPSADTPASTGAAASSAAEPDAAPAAGPDATSAAGSDAAPAEAPDAASTAGPDAAPSATPDDAAATDVPDAPEPPPADAPAEPAQPPSGEAAGS